jgi:anion-transporting  ArsA/GET3 family ATPase
MASLLERKLIVVTGKGGTGKSTVACALGLIAAHRGLRTIVVEVGGQHHIPELFAAHGSRTGDPDHLERPRRAHPDHLERTRHAHPDDLERARHAHPAEEVELQDGLWSTSIDPERAMIEWLRLLSGRISARMLAASSTFQYFAAAAPGAKELVTMVKVRELCEGHDSDKSTPDDAQHHSRRHARRYDLVVLDAPATGHALAMLHSPQTFASIVRVGPLAEQARLVRELLEDPQRSGYLAVTHATEMSITETLELAQGCAGA